MLPNGLSAAHVTPRTWISILALEGARHRNDGAVPQPKMENRPKLSLPRNAASPLSLLICHRRGATRGWGVGPLGKVSWAASINMCAFPDLLLWSLLAWELTLGVVSYVPGQKPELHTLKALPTLGTDSLCHCWPLCGPDEEVMEGQAHLKHWVLKTSGPISPHHPVSLFGKHVHHTGVASRLQAAKGRVGSSHLDT